MKYEVVSNKDRIKPSAHTEMHDTKDIYGNNVGREVEDDFFSGKLAVQKKKKKASCFLLKDKMARWDAQRAQLVKWQNPRMSCSTYIHPLGHLETLILLRIRRVYHGHIPIQCHFTIMPLAVWIYVYVSAITG